MHIYPLLFGVRVLTDFRILPSVFSSHFFYMKEHMAPSMDNLTLPVWIM